MEVRDPIINAVPASVGDCIKAVFVPHHPWLHFAMHNLENHTSLIHHLLDDSMRAEIH